MSDDADETLAPRPLTITAGVAVGFVSAGLVLVRNILAVVHPPTVAFTRTAQEQHAIRIGVSIGTGVGAVIGTAACVAIVVAGAGALRGSHGWRVGLGALVGWQAVGSVFGAVATGVDNTMAFAHIRQPSPALLIATAITGGLCCLLLFLPEGNRWYRAQRPLPQPVTAPAPAGWYPVEDRLRWWDGSSWTEHTHPLAVADDQPTTETHD